VPGTCDHRTELDDLRASVFKICSAQVSEYSAICAVLAGHDRICGCIHNPLCRQHHQAKQASGWRLDQPEPGIMIWTTPSGRRYATGPTRY
jgi:hypothetical protein